MKKITPKLIAVLLFSVVLLSCSKEEDGIYFNDLSDEAPIAYSAIEQEILDLVNEHRVSIGLTSLKPLNLISSVAGGHTNYMIDQGKVSHDNFSNRTQTLTTKANAKKVGENVAYGYNSAQGVVSGWLKSPSHKAILENEYYTNFGISTRSNEKGRNYFTQIFIKR